MRLLEIDISCLLKDDGPSPQVQVLGSELIRLRIYGACYVGQRQMIVGLGLCPVQRLFCTHVFELSPHL